MTTTAVTEQTSEQPAQPAEPAREPDGPPPPLPVRRRPLSFEARAASQALLMLAAGLLGLVVFLLVITPIQQSNEQDRLYATFREQLAEATAPTGGLIDAGTPVALLTIPGLSLDQVVVEGTASGDLHLGPGHRRNTPLPGQAGISLIYGKAVTYGAPFRQLGALRPGDRITVTTGEGVFTYRVRDVRRPGDPIPSPPASGAGRLILESSEGPNPLQHEGTVLVDADLLGAPAATPSGRPTVIPPEENAMAGDGGALIVVVLLLQALGVLFAAVVWGRRRWGGREALLVGLPLILAVLWNLYEAVSRLLPNLV